MVGGRTAGGGTVGERTLTDPIDCFKDFTFDGGTVGGGVEVNLSAGFTGGTIGVATNRVAGGYIGKIVGPGLKSVIPDRLDATVDCHYCLAEPVIGVAGCDDDVSLKVSELRCVWGVPR